MSSACLCPTEGGLNTMCCGGKTHVFDRTIDYGRRGTVIFTQAKEEGDGVIRTVFQLPRYEEKLRYTAELKTSLYNV